MGNGYIKLYRQINDNELLANDNTCWVVFTKLLLLVDRRTGSYKMGYRRLANLCNLKNMTAYDALQRLNRGGIIRFETVQAPYNNRTSTVRKPCIIYVCNWHKYQAETVQSPYDDRHFTEIIQEGEEENNTTNVVSSNSASELTSPDSFAKLGEKAGSDAPSARFAPLHRQICQIFGKNPERYALTDRRRRTLKTRLQHFSEDDIVKACTNLAASTWHMGENDRGWTADPYWCLSSREKCEEWLNRATQEQTIASINLAEV